MDDKRFEKIKSRYNPAIKISNISVAICTIIPAVILLLSVKMSFEYGLIILLSLAAFLSVCLCVDIYIHYSKMINNYNELFDEYTKIMDFQCEQENKIKKLMLNRDGLEELIKKKNLEIDYYKKKLDRYQIVEFTRSRYIIAQKNGGIDSLEDSKLVREFTNKEGERKDE